MSKRTREPVDWREGRRLRAWDLHQQGWTQTKIAEAMGVTQGAVSQWIKRGTRGGRDALHRQPAPGSTPRLSLEQRQQLKQLLRQPATAFGFIGDVWTTKRIAALIKEHFGVSYHAAHVSRIVRALDLTPQLPQVRATQRDEDSIPAWQQETWPVLKKRQKPRKELSSG